MKHKLSLWILVFGTMLLALNLKAQCGGPRYIDSVFSDISITTVTYSDTYNLKMDIYQPVGDTASARPLLVLAHGGTFISGNKTNDNTIINLCNYFAKHGYVAASIDYRLLTNGGDLLDSIKTITEVMQSISDGKAAVRFFYKDAYTVDSFRIDTSKIFIGGNSAGAVLFLHYAYIDSLGELPPYLQAIIDSNGGIPGNSGNPGYSTKVRGVINLAGGLNNPDWLGACSLPIVSAQGDADAIVPYHCGYPTFDYYLQIPVKLCGLGSLQSNITANTPYWSSITFPGQGHVPWDGNAGLMYQVDTLVNNFLYTSMCTSVPTSCPAALANSVSYIQQITNISLFPNPATEVLNIESSERIVSMSIYDETGRLINQLNNLNSFNYQLSTTTFSKGVYILKLNAGENYSPAIRKVVIE